MSPEDLATAADTTARTVEAVEDGRNALRHDLPCKLAGGLDHAAITTSGMLQLVPTTKIISTRHHWGAEAVRRHEPRRQRRYGSRLNAVVTLFVALSVLALLSLGAHARPAFAAAPCPDYLFLGATGSGGNNAGPQNHGMGTIVNDVYDRVTKQLGSQSETSSLNIEPEPVNYPATGVGPSFNLLEDINGVGSFLHLGPLGDYQASVLQGTEEAIKDVNNFMSRCGSNGAKVILSGYSQGAQAIADAVEGKANKSGVKMDTSGIVGAAFFGDPYFNPRSDADEGDFDPGRQGVLGKRGEYPRSLMFPERRIHSFCRNKDPICQGFFSSTLIPFPDFDANRHKVYATEGSTATAAVEIENLIRDDQATHGNIVPDPIPTTISGPLDVVFAIDTTGSMGDLIGGVKSDVENIVSQLSTLDPDYRVALVDYKDALPYSNDPYQAKIDQNFTAEESPFDEAVESLSAEGGGDTPESVYTGIMTGLELPWRVGAHKVLIAMGDAGGHSPDPVTGYTAQDVIAKALSLDPVAIYGLVGHGSTEAEETFGELAKETGGETVPIENAEEVPGAINGAITASAEAPTADAGGPYTGYVGSPTVLSAASSSSPLGRKLTYEWDTNGDGVYDLVTESPVTTTTWTEPYSGPINLRVTDSKGLVGVAQTTGDLSGTAPLAPSTPSTPAVVAGDGEVKATWSPGAGGGPVGYYVLRDANNNPVGYLTPTGEGAQSANIPELPNGTPFALDVAGVNISGESPSSALSPFVTPLGLEPLTNEPPSAPNGPPPGHGVESSKHSALANPAITGLHQSASRWHTGHKLAAISVRRNSPVGTVFSFSLNEQATITFTFRKQVLGTRHGRRCVAGHPRQATGRRCTLTILAGRLKLAGHAGLNRLVFQGRLSSSRRLSPGSYSLGVVATNAETVRSSSASLKFVILGSTRAHS
jgi:hypothetical protein